ARASIRRLRRENPGCRILVTGCYAQRAPNEIAVLPGVTWVVGNSHKHLAAEIATANFKKRSADISPHLVPLDSLRSAIDGSDFIPLKQISESANSNVVVGDIFAHTELLAAPVFDAANERTRPNLKVQDGCDNRCSFCVIPYVRGQSRSLPLDRVLAEVRSLLRAGYREVVISGINLVSLGRDFQAPLRFADLVSAILERTALEQRRTSSVEPMDWSDELIALIAGSHRIAKHA